MPEAEQTNDGEYEFIKYHTFEGVDYHRTMSWKGGDGHIGMGVREIASQKTDVDTEAVRLPAGWSVIVVNTDFKLVQQSSEERAQPT